MSVGYTEGGRHRRIPGVARVFRPAGVATRVVVGRLSWRKFRKAAVDAFEAGALQRVPREAVPKSGTFWMLSGLRGARNVRPLPYRPKKRDLPVYALSEGVFLVDDSSR